jgi:hypothetical protein
LGILFVLIPFEWVTEDGSGDAFIISCFDNIVLRLMAGGSDQFSRCKHKETVQSKKRSNGCRRIHECVFRYNHLDKASAVMLMRLFGLEKVKTSNSIHCAAVGRVLKAGECPKRDFP